MDAHEEAAPDHASGMKFCEILFIKSARLEQHHGQRVAQREHDRRARCRREIERTRFLLDVHIEKNMRVFRKGRFWITANGDDFHLKARDRGQDAQKFLGLAACAQGEDDIAVGHHPEIAVQRV